MYELAICSLFRDNVCHNNLDRYLRQITQQTFSFEKTLFSWIEGDSQDLIYHCLSEFAKNKENIIISKKDIGNKYFGSTKDSKRFEMLSKIGNETLKQIIGKSKFVLWLESDLIISCDIVEKLLKHFSSPKIGIVAPLIFLENTELFYDTFAFKGINNYEKWDHYYPYAKCYKKDSIIEMSSVGSCCMFRNKILEEGVTFPPTNCIVGFCGIAKTIGYKIYCDTSLKIYHPFKKIIGGDRLI